MCPCRVFAMGGSLNVLATGLVRVVAEGAPFPTTTSQRDKDVMIFELRKMFDASPTIHPSPPTDKFFTPQVVPRRDPRRGKGRRYY